MPSIGIPELILILIVVIVLLGMGKVPQLARSLGEVVREIRKGRGSDKAVSSGEPGTLSPAERSASRLERALDQVMQATGEGLTLAVLLQVLLHFFDISEYRLAAETGIDRSTINRLLKGETKKPQKQTLLKILSVFPLDARWRAEILTLAGYPPAEATPALEHPPQVYLSCHGEDLVPERRAVIASLSGSRSFYAVESGDETWPREQVEASVRHSDYLVMVQGWRWVSLRRIEYQAAQGSEQAATGLYFQKQGLHLQPETEQFLGEIGREQWRSFADADALAEQVWTGLTETMVREARAGRARLSLQDMAVLYLTTRLLAGEETALPASLRRLAAGRSERPGTGEESPKPEPATRAQRWERHHPAEPELVRIPAGEFWMGTNRLALELAGIEWRDWLDNETPYHPVRLPDYAIGKYPVTNAEFARFVDEGGYTTRKYWTEAGREAKERAAWSQPRYWRDEQFNDPSQPVVEVSWYEAVAYCNWLAAKTGRPYRLPTEAEWEKAARGTDGRLWPWGNRWDPDRCNTSEGGPGRPTPVGQYSPRGDSPYDVADMVGNVWEWTLSLFKGYPYDSRDGRESLEAGDFRVLRGGSFGSKREPARCAYRYWRSPHFGWYFYGFRVVVFPISPTSAL